MIYINELTDTIYVSKSIKDFDDKYVIDGDIVGELKVTNKLSNISTTFDFAFVDIDKRYYGIEGSFSGLTEGFSSYEIRLYNGVDNDMVEVGLLFKDGVQQDFLKINEEPDNILVL